MTSVERERATIAQCEYRRLSPRAVEPIAQCACSETCGDIGDQESVLVIGRMTRDSTGIITRWRDVIRNDNYCMATYLANLPTVQFVESGIAWQMLGPDEDGR